MSSRLSVTFAALALVATCTGRAGANGRFPRALHLVEDSCDPDHLVLSATYGLVTTFDHGAHWFHTCERAFALQDGYNGDPLIALLAGGSMLVNAQTGMRAARGDACGFSKSLELPTETIADFTVSRRGGESVLAVSSDLSGASPVHSLRESHDQGLTWQVVGAPLPAQIIYTIDVAPSEPDAIYATGLSDANQGVFLRSDDHGRTWTTTLIPDTDSDAVPYIAAVHPSDKKKVFVRTDAWTNRSLIDTAADALLFSNDAGATWRRVIPERRAKLLGFALSPDGATVLAGYGDTSAPGVDIDPAATGLFAAPLDTLTFAQTKEGSITCLTWTAHGLFVCTPEADTGFQLARADGPTGELVPLLSLSKITGELPGCGAACDWTVSCDVFAACDNKPDPAARTSSARTCASAGSDAGSSAPAEAGADAASDGPRSEDHVEEVAPSSGSSGCAVSRQPRPSSLPAVPAFAGLLLGASLRGVRRRARRHAADPR